MKLLLLRHAESMGNATGRYSSQEADSLSPRGQAQARSLVDTLTQWDFASIICSPLERTRDTIKPYLVATGQRAEIWPEIAEACWHEEREEVAPSWNSQPTDPLSAAYQTQFYYRDGQLLKACHPESFGAGLCRVHAAMDMLNEMAAKTDATVLIVIHGHVIRELLNLMLDTRSTRQFHQENCGMTLMSYHYGWHMEFCNRLVASIHTTT